MIFFLLKKNISFVSMVNKLCSTDPIFFPIPTSTTWIGNVNFKLFPIQCYRRCRIFPHTRKHWIKTISIRLSVCGKIAWAFFVGMCFASISCFQSVAMMDKTQSSFSKSSMEFAHHSIFPPPKLWIPRDYLWQEDDKNTVKHKTFPSYNPSQLLCSNLTYMVL